MFGFVWGVVYCGCLRICGCLCVGWFTFVVCWDCGCWCLLHRFGSCLTLDGALLCATICVCCLLFVVVYCCICGLWFCVLLTVNSVGLDVLLVFM